jgi:hypothetical protein
MRSSFLFAIVALGALAATAPAEAQGFPHDSGVLNVRDFGATGDGRHDDTVAITAAIAAAGADTGRSFWETRIVFLPAGTYRVSGTLVKRYADGRFGSGMVLMGESEAATTIRLADHAPGFGDAATPRGVIMTTAKLLDGTPTSGGKDYTHKGEGNDAYENFVEDLTVDVGAGNPGAIGIDYLANNLGAVRDMRVTAPAGSGAVGISLQRKWPGPALLQRVEVDGFDTGIAVANTEYGMTLDHVTLRGQRRVALANDSNAVSAAQLAIETGATAIANTAPGGLIVLTDSRVHAAGEGADFLVNRGTVVAHGVTLEGFAAKQAGTLNGVWVGQQWQPRPPLALALALALEDAPPGIAEPPEKWVNVLRFAHGAARPQDITNALRQAMATGAATIYLPYGRYAITDSVAIPPTVRRIVGMNAAITVPPDRRRPEFARDAGMFRVNEPGPPLMIERVVFDMSDLGDQLAVQVTARRDVTLRDIVTAGTSVERAAGGGRMFIDDICCGSLHFSGPAPVYARQLNTEGGDERIVNEGSPLAIVGLKTEGDCVVLDNRRGARTEILGGLVYIVQDADPAIPLFRNTGGTLLASFIEESFRAASHYSTYVQDRMTHRDVPAVSASLPRGYGRLVPWLATGG